MLGTGGCFQVSEIEEFRLQGEAVVLRCPKMERLLAKRGLLHAIGHTYHFTGADMVTLLPNDTGRVRTQGRHLWFLPARTTDTGNYTCIFRCAIPSCLNISRNNTLLVLYVEKYAVWISIFVTQ